MTPVDKVIVAKKEIKRRGLYVHVGRVTLVIIGVVLMIPIHNKEDEATISMFIFGLMLVIAVIGSVLE